MFDKYIYVERRKKLKELMGSGVIILPGNQESPRNYLGNDYNFEQDSCFLYYFGIDIPGLIGVIDIDENKDYIFGSDYTIDDVIWMGDQKLIKEYAIDSGVETFIEMTYFNDFIHKTLKKERKILLLPQYRADTILQLSLALGINPHYIDNYISEKLIKAVVSQRNIKSKLEILQIEDAVNITREMHLEAMKVTKVGMKEYEVVSALEAIAKKYNASTSFFTIFTKNGQTLHNHFHGNTLEEGDIVILDCGARNKNGYCGDMTTTFPVSGKFSPKQKDIYLLLIKMFETAEKLLKPGINYKEIHLQVAKTLAQGLVSQGLMKGNPDDIVKSGAHALFMPHGLGHMLGLDVHDMEGLGEDFVGYDKFPRDSQFGLSALRLARDLEPGFVFTVEPGIYFIPQLIKKWKQENKFLEFLNYDIIEKYIDFGGMRYEGDFVITESGARRLGNKMPKYPEEIENIMKK